MKHFAVMRHTHHRTSTSQCIFTFPGNTGDALKLSAVFSGEEITCDPPAASQDCVSSLCTPAQSAALSLGCCSPSLQGLVGGK